MPEEMKKEKKKKQGLFKLVQMMEVVDGGKWR